MRTAYPTKSATKSSSFSVSFSLPMTQVDLEIIVCGDRKIVCEAVIEGSDLPKISPAPSPPDLRAESFRLPTVEDEIDWVDRNAFLQRKQSTKALSISTSHPTSALRPSPPFAKPKPFIGLPKRPHLSQPSRRPLRQPPAPSAGGRALLSQGLLHRPRPPQDQVSTQPPPQIASAAAERLAAFWELLGSFGRRKKQPKRALNDRPLPPPAKLESGRAAADVAGGDLKGDHSVWRRHPVGSPEPVDRARDGASVGPATV